jgi:large subunit ribosomal protein L18
VIDDSIGHTIAPPRRSSRRSEAERRQRRCGAPTVGNARRERAKDKGITTVVFDRGGSRYHGRVAALRRSARAAGLEF